MSYQLPDMTSELSLYYIDYIIKALRVKNIDLSIYNTTQHKLYGLIKRYYYQLNGVIENTPPSKDMIISLFIMNHIQQLNRVASPPIINDLPEDYIHDILRYIYLIEWYGKMSLSKYNQLKQLINTYYQILSSKLRKPPSHELLIYTLYMVPDIGDSLLLHCKLPPSITKLFTENSKDMKDGNNLFYSLGKVLNTPHTDIRNAICDYMNRERESFFNQDDVKKYSSIIDDMIRFSRDRNTGINMYIEYMRRDKTWGTFIEIYAAMLLYNRPILFITPNEKDLKLQSNFYKKYKISDDIDTRIYLGLCESNNLTTPFVILPCIYFKLLQLKGALQKITPSAPKAILVKSSLASPDDDTPTPEPKSGIVKSSLASPDDTSTPEPKSGTVKSSLASPVDILASVDAKTKAEAKARLQKSHLAYISQIAHASLIGPVPLETNVTRLLADEKQNRKLLNRIKQLDTQRENKQSHTIQIHNTREDIIKHIIKYIETLKEI